MQILAALFVDEFDVRQVPGPSTRLDLTGVHFSAPAPGPFPVSLSPHLVVVLHCPPELPDVAALTVTYHRDGEEVARNVQPVQVDPGKFGFRLVRAELEFDAPGTVEAHVCLDGGDPLFVPFTLLPPIA